MESLPELGHSLGLTVEKLPSPIYFLRNNSQHRSVSPLSSLKVHLESKQVFINFVSVNPIPPYSLKWLVIIQIGYLIQGFQLSFKQQTCGRTQHQHGQFIGPTAGFASQFAVQ